MPQWTALIVCCALALLFILYLGPPIADGLRRFQMKTPRTGFAVLCMLAALFVIFSQKTGNTYSGGGNTNSHTGLGGIKLPGTMSGGGTENEDDLDGDNIPCLWEDAVYMNKTDPEDAGSLKYDNSMTALEKYQISADWRVTDSGGDGINDAWKVKYGLFPVYEDIG